MKLLILILLFGLSFNHIPLIDGKFSIDQPSHKNGLILKTILSNFILKYMSNDDDTRYLSFIVSNGVETAFKNEFLNNFYGDPIVSRYTCSISNILHNSTAGLRQKSFNMIFIPDGETLKYVLYTLHSQSNSI